MKNIPHRNVSGVTLSLSDGFRLIGSVEKT